MPSKTNKDGYLEGQMLIAMPSMGDPRFERSVIYVCAHSDQGAMGFVVNRRVDSISFTSLLDQLQIGYPQMGQVPPIHFGGPVDSERGFVLHSVDYFASEATLKVDDKVGLTATIDILKSIADGNGPNDSILALGYSGWGPSQLESEIQANGWLSCEADKELLFGDDNDNKWDRALAKIGVDASVLSSTAGHA